MNHPVSGVQVWNYSKLAFEILRRPRNARFGDILSQMRPGSETTTIGLPINGTSEGSNIPV